MNVKFSISNEMTEKLGDILLSLTALSQFFMTALQIFVTESGILSEGIAAILRVICSVLFVLLSIYYMLARNLKLFFLSYWICSTLFILSALQNEAHWEYILNEGVRFTLCINIPIFLSIASIRDFKIFLRISLWIALATAFVGILYGISFFSGGLPFKEESYNMSLGYALLFPTLFLLSHKRLLFSLIAIALSIVILLLGSRGPLVPIILFIFCQRLLLGTNKERIGVLLFVAIFTIILFPVLLDFLSLQGVESRTLNLILSGEAISHDSGRSVLYNAVKEKILENPIWGYGVFADRIFCNGIYCHNIFLELFTDFGCLFPMLLLTFLLSCILYMLRHMDKNEIIFCLLFSLCAIVPLLVTGSYLTDFRFFLFIGYLYSMFHKYILKKTHQEL